MSEKGYVYKFLDKSGNLLYVGKTKNIEQRMKQHKANGHLTKEQYEKVCSIYFVELGSMNDAGLLERYMIANLEPEFNKEFSGEGKCEIMIEMPSDSLWKLYSTTDGFVEYMESFSDHIMSLLGNMDIAHWIFIQGVSDLFIFKNRTYIGCVPIVDCEGSRERTGYFYKTLKRMGCDTAFVEKTWLENFLKSSSTPLIKILIDGTVLGENGENLCQIPYLRNLENNKEDLHNMLIAISAIKAVIRIANRKLLLAKSLTKREMQA